MARQGETAALDVEARDLVDAFLADLNVLVRQAALDAFRDVLRTPAQAPSEPEAAMVPRRKLHATPVIELTPAAPRIRQGQGSEREFAPAVPPSITRGLSEAIVECLEARPGLRLDELVAALGEEARPVIRALTKLVVEERIVAAGAGRAMRYVLLGSEPVVELEPVQPPVGKRRSVMSSAPAPAAPLRRRFDAAELEGAILIYLAENPDLRAEDIWGALHAEPAEVKRALAELRADGRVRTTGRTRGTRYSLRTDDGAVEGPRREAEAEQADALAADGAVPVVAS